MKDSEKLHSQFPHLIRVYAGVKNSSHWLDMEEIAQLTGVNTHSIRRLAPMLHRLGVFDCARSSNSFYYKITNHPQGRKHMLALETAYRRLMEAALLRATEPSYKAQIPIE
ncbi:MAG: hypothetical protein F6K47_23910 [Symploca sp. SIO2E6]|nr:hypothetical protein [Symploca sp. SIO2E6]